MLKSLLFTAVGAALCGAVVASETSNNPFLPGDHQIRVATDFIVRDVPWRLYQDRMQRLVETASAGQATVSRIFQGPGGLTGVVLTGPGPKHAKMIGWVPPGGEMLIVGNVFDGQGKNLTVTAANAYDINPSTDDDAAIEVFPLHDIYQRAADHKGIDLFDGDRTLYVFADPQSKASRKLYYRLLEMSDTFTAQSIRVRWLPVAVYGEGSRRDAAGLIKQGLPGMEQYAQHSLLTVLDATDDAQYIDAADANTVLMLQATPNDVQVPRMMWKDGEGQIRTSAGLPSAEKLKTLIANVASDDTELAEDRIRVLRTPAEENRPSAATPAGATEARLKPGSSQGDRYLPQRHAPSAAKRGGGGAG